VRKTFVIDIVHGERSYWDWL